MSSRTAGMLPAWLLVAATLGCGDKPSQPEVEPDVTEIERLAQRIQYDEERPDRPIVSVDLAYS